MFECLMYLFENYVHSEMDIMVDNEILTDELTDAGFHKEAVSKALAWIERLASMQLDTTFRPSKHLNAIRIFTTEEMQHFDLECRGFLHFLEQINVLNSETREMVIDRACEIEGNGFSLDDLKWVILMVLFNLPGQEREFTQLEGIMFDESGGIIH